VNDNRYRDDDNDDVSGSNLVLILHRWMRGLMFQFRHRVRLTLYEHIETAEKRTTV